MMKSMRVLAPLCALLVLIAGCGQGSSPPGSAAAPGFAAEDLSLSVGGVAYRCNMDIEAVIADLGDGYDYAEGMSCDYDGMDKTFAYETASFYTNPLAEGDLINEIYTLDPAVVTSKGIAVGASRAAVLAAYGEDCEEDGGLLVYRLDGEQAKLCFELDDDTVWAIFLTTQPV